jgi:hypothetical protein
MANKINTAWIIVGPKDRLDEFEYSLAASRRDAIFNFLTDLSTPEINHRGPTPGRWPSYKRHGYKCIKVVWCAK